MTRRPASLRAALVLVALVLPVAAACGSSAPAATPTPVPVATATPAPAMSPGVTVDGSTVTIVGLGRSVSEPFDLPAGSARMTITACASNQVMPFITLVHESGQAAGIVVDPEKVLNNLAGGSYSISSQANPNCLWTVTLTPQ